MRYRRRRNKNPWGRVVIKYCWKVHKPMYDKKGATSARNKQYKQRRVQLRVYPCPYCKAWHLSSRL